MFYFDDLDFFFTKLTFALLTVLLSFSLGSAPSRFFSPPNTQPKFQDSECLTPSVFRPLSFSMEVDEGRSVFGEVEERASGTRAWLWRWKCLFLEGVCISTELGGDLVEPWWDTGDRSPRSSSWALDRAAVSSSLSSHSLLTVSWSNATWRERGEVPYKHYFNVLSFSWKNIVLL